MRKEVFFAILAGAVFGLAIAFGIWKANFSIKPKTETSNIVNPEVSPSPTPEPETDLTIAKPQDYSVFNENPVKVEGITKVNAWVSISGETEDYLVRADNKGAFSQDIELAGGVNEIIVTAFDSNGATSTQKFLAVFSTEFK